VGTATVDRLEVVAERLQVVTEELRTRIKELQEDPDRIPRRVNRSEDGEN
jgi:hypothetical protein